MLKTIATPLFALPAAEAERRGVPKAEVYWSNPAGIVAKDSPPCKVRLSAAVLAAAAPLRAMADLFAQAEAATSGGVNARNGGSGSVHSSISTMLVPVDGPWLSFDVPRSWVSTLALPCAHMASSLAPAGSYQAPQESLATPGDTMSVSIAPARQAPRPLWTRTISPSLMPRR